jgi:hypothetical protein
LPSSIFVEQIILISTGVIVDRAAESVERDPRAALGHIERVGDTPHHPAYWGNVSIGGLVARGRQIGGPDHSLVSRWADQPKRPVI